MTALTRRLFGALVIGAAALVSAPSFAQSGTPHLILTLESGDVDIELLPELAPKHVERIVTLTEEGAYDGVVFHRVIDGFMAQTGDVQYGKQGGKSFAPARAGMGGSDMPDIPAEFSRTPFERGVVGMARSQSPNSANSQFFIMFTKYPSLDGQYTVVGKVVSGMENVDKIKKGAGSNGEVTDPDRMLKVTVGK